MPLVFVHGVNVRKQAADDPPGQPTLYESSVQRRDGFFEEIVLRPLLAAGSNIVIKNPYWGGDAARFPWNHGGLPVGVYESFGPEANLDPKLVVPALALSNLQVWNDRNPPSEILPWLARRDFAAAINLLVLTANDPRFPLVEAQKLARLADGLGGYADFYAAKPPEWVTSDANSGMNNSQFLDKLMTEMETFRDDTPRTPEEWESFGPLDDAWQGLRSAVTRITNATVRLAGGDLLGNIRESIHKPIATFLGDIFIYLKRRQEFGENEPILKSVLADLDAAYQIKQERNEPLILVGHSMGGNVLYDCLTKYRPQMEVDLLLTVGSQLALFEELKLFAVSNENLPTAAVPKVAKPANIKRWFNVFDKKDILGFAASTVFAGVEDFEFDTGDLPIVAHSGYFSDAIFFHRLSKRLRQ